MKSLPGFLSKRKKNVTPALISLWIAFLLLPFKGPYAALLLFVILTATIPLTMQIIAIVRKIRVPALMPRSLPPVAKHFYLLLLLVSAAVPFVAKDYIIDVAIISGIYIILALGLNVVIGFAGLLNLGFVAFYAIGAYSYALINTKLGIGFWTAMPVSVLFTTMVGFLLAVPALRLKGDYLAIVTLGFGEIVRLTLNNWDSLTMGPNGISGIAPPSMLSVPIDSLTAYYYLVLVFVVLAVFIMRRVKDSKTGRAWIALREDEIASSSLGINTVLYKLYSFAFGAFWAGLAGCLFAAKMRFVSPESFTFIESVLIVCMVILGGLGSIAGVIIGAVILVFLPEVLREVQMYRMLALGAGLVLLMVFRPQGLFGGRSVSLGS